MIKWYKILGITVLIFTACSIDKDKKVERERFSFKTGDDTELFFKNMRASYYDKEIKKETRWEIYRHEDLYSIEDSMALNIAIILNILNDEAYIMVEPGKTLSEWEEIQVIVQDQNNKISDSILYDQPDKEGMLEFASQLYESILDNEKLVIINNEDTIPILNENSRREAFRITMSDYYRLTRVF